MAGVKQQEGERLMQEGEQQPEAPSCCARMRAKTVCLKPLAALLLHLADTCSDALLCRQLLQRGDYWWAGIGVAFILVAGLASAIGAAGAGVRGLRLVLYVLGLGPIVEVAMTPAVIAEAGHSWRLVGVWGMETLLEALPSSGFQLYMIIFRGTEQATRLQFFSAGISVLSVGYGVMSMLRDFSLGPYMISAARSLQGSVAIALLVVLELLLYVIPMSLFFKAPEYRPWSVVATPAILVSFEVLVGLWAAGWRALGDPKTLFFIVLWALAACYSIAARVLVLWRREGDEAEQAARPLWLSHLGQLLARAIVLPLALPGLYWAWGAFGALAACATGLVWLVADAKAKHPQVDEIEAPKDVSAGKEIEPLCGCF